MADLHGTCDDRFRAVADTLAANLDSGADLGASVAVSVDGEMLVDVWGGHADAGRTRSWESDTIANVWSTTKTMTALCALMLADRGTLDLHAPVAEYWPEFAANGKEGVEVRHLLGHTAGLSGWEEPVDESVLYDWDRATSLLAAQAPWWEPGTASGYHAVTQGYLVGEVIRRVDGRTVGQFLAEELAGPLGADFHIGLPTADDHRVAELVPPPDMSEQLAATASELTIKTLTNPVMSAEMTASDAWRRAEIPAAGGHGNARSVARIQSVLACGGELDGRRFLSAEGCEAVFEEQSYGVDLVLGLPLRFGMGYGLPSQDIPFPNERTCFWAGWGGSLVIVDLESRAVFAYVMNKMADGLVGDDRGLGLAAAALGAIAVA
ncbi:MAG TPA: serine hydrolase domain-containing protein [Acidimicrobiales bacterium]|nr:serine hydrolase domain-containing protein [Acidimicrobiales bacterium]